MTRHAVKVIKLDISRGNIVECAMPVGARVIGGHVTIENPKLVLAGRGKSGILPAVTVWFDPDEQRMEQRRLVVIATGKDGAAQAIEYEEPRASRTAARAATARTVRARRTSTHPSALRRNGSSSSRRPRPHPNPSAPATSSRSSAARLPASAGSSPSTMRAATRRGSPAGRRPA